jgi:metallo-beta-lactamase family protein
MKIKFCGASKTVTGSCYYFETESTKFLVDCGMFQGPDVEELNKEAFKFNPEEVDFLLLTHAHLDHCGLIPKLVRAGFKGTIYSTPYTQKISESILLDSAKLQEEGMRRRNLSSIYNTQDAINSIRLFESKEIDKEIIHNDVKFIFRKASHILGAVSIEIYNGNESITMSGDLGRTNDRLIEPYNNNYNTTHTYVMESLYGDRNHEEMDKSVDRLTTIVNNTLERNGIVMIPVFAMHRSLLMIDIIQELINQKRIRDDVKMALDSPLANKIANVYKEYNSRLNLSNFPSLVYKKRDLLKHNTKNFRIILAGGGMANGGRILNYFKRHITNKNNTVMFVGYQAEETLGRELVEGARTIELDSKIYTVAAEIVNIEGFSAHADQSELLWWISRFRKEEIRKVFLVHSEIEKSNVLKTKLNERFPGLDINIPDMYQEEIID